MNGSAQPPEPISLPRAESAVFADLEEVCKTSGYVHALSYIIFRDGVVTGGEEFKKEDFGKLYDRDRLIRTEFEVLIGLWLKGGREIDVPEPAVIQSMIDRTDALIAELHAAMLAPAHSDFAKAIRTQAEGQEFESPLGQGSFLREAIFYSGESAFSFQYSEFSSRRYSRDSNWIKTKYGFDMSDACAVFDAIIKCLAEKFPVEFKSLGLTRMRDWTLLPLFTFEISDIFERVELGASVIHAVIEQFSVPDGQTNDSYTGHSDLNDATLFPLIRLANGKIAFLLEYTGTGALYNSPAYWMRLDEKYIDVAAINRGEFTEEIVEELLGRAFPPSRIFHNVVFKESKKVTSGEADIIFIHGKRAFVVQIKSKGLTESAKAGDDKAISQDFAAAFQKAYDQATRCIELMKRRIPTFIDGTPFSLPGLETVEEFYPVCLTSEHYPALSFQARHFLTTKRSEQLNNPIIMDIFTLDVVTEFLTSPLYLVDYLAKRSLLYDKIMSSHELVTLAYHLRGNLFVPDDIHMMMVEDDFMIELDLAMNVRRRGLPGQRTPSGILTRDLANPLGRILSAVDRTDRSDVHQLGEFLLNLSSDGWKNINKWLSGMVAQTKRDSRNHDVTVPLEESGAGLTVHCNDHSDKMAFDALASHCEVRKYVHNADRWFGVCLSSDGEVRFAIGRISPWHFDAGLESEAENLKVRSANHWVDPSGRRTKLGRNDLCPCGSGKKYKKCCLH